MKTPALAPNAIIADRYRLLRPLGDGAMGVVWAAANVLTSRHVALKFILGPDEELRRRMLREARSCGALQHRNIVDIYDVTQAGDGNPVLVMQLLTGETLADLLARKRRLPPHRAAAIGHDVAGALAAAHAIGVVHRDVKPANIFLHEEGAPEPVVKVLDFGVSKDLSGADSIRTVTGGVVGSPSYMSPEQARADTDIDGRADIWSLGVTMFEMLTGMLPFPGSIEDVLRQIFTAEIPLVSRRLRHVDPALSDLVARCMERDRSRRFASAAELVAALEAILAPASHSRVPEEPARAGEQGPREGLALQTPTPYPRESSPGDTPPSVPFEARLPHGGDPSAGLTESGTLKITTAAVDVLAPPQNRRSDGPGIDAFPRGVSPDDSASWAPTPLIVQPAASATEASAGVTSSTAPFSRAAPGHPINPGIAEPAPMPRAVSSRRADRGVPLVVGVSLMGTCIAGALVYALSSPPPPLASPSPPLTGSEVPSGNIGLPPGEPSTGPEPAAPPSPTAESDLDEPVRDAPDVGARPTARGVKPSPPSPSALAPPVPSGDGSFNRGAATVAVASAAAAVKRCKTANGLSGPGRARILFRPDGTAGSVLLDPPYRGSSQVSCIEGTFRSVRVPPFVGPPVLVTKSFVIP